MYKPDHEPLTGRRFLIIEDEIFQAGHIQQMLIELGGAVEQIAVTHEQDRGHGGTSPPIVLFRYAPGRSGAFAEQFLQGFRGQLLQCDGYEGYERLTRIERPQGPWTLVHCWCHLRRRFVKQMRNTKSPIAEAAVRQIAALYAVEATVRGMAPADRLAARQELSAPIVDALRPWFEKQLSMISSGSTLATDIRYALARWEGVTRFLDDGRLELDTNPVENAIRPVARQERMHSSPVMRSGPKIGRCSPPSWRPAS